LVLSDEITQSNYLPSPALSSLEVIGSSKMERHPPKEEFWFHNMVQPYKDQMSSDTAATRQVAAKPDHNKAKAKSGEGGSKVDDSSSDSSSDAFLVYNDGQSTNKNQAQPLKKDLQQTKQRDRNKADRNKAKPKSGEGGSKVDDS